MTPIDAHTGGMETMESGRGALGGAEGTQSGAVEGVGPTASAAVKLTQAQRDILAWRDAAVADGWTLSEYYAGESLDTAFRLEREGYSLSATARGYGSDSISIWAPDRLSISLTSPIYPGFEYIRAGVRRCNNCAAEDVDTQRYSFAGRCCERCLPEMRRVHEYRGWTN